MATVLQFQSLASPTAVSLKANLVAWFNNSSTLAFRARNQVGYVTQPFGIDVWKQHNVMPGLYWLDYGAIYAHLGDLGQEQADLMLGTVGTPALLTSATLFGITTLKLQLVAVSDLVASGYLPSS